MTDQEMQQQLEMHLHEQYAINNNAKSSTLTSIITAFLIAFTGLGIAFYYSISASKYSPLLFVAIVTVDAVVTLLYCICISLGASQRENQKIIYRIRKQHIDDDEYKAIFGEMYSPFDKTWCDFVQGYYNELSMFFAIILVFVQFPFFLCHSIMDRRYIAIAFICTFICYIVMVAVKACKYYKYKNNA